MSEKSKLSKALLYAPENGYDRLPENEKAAMHDYCESYKDFLNHGKTERLCVEHCIELASARGFVPYEKGMALKTGDKVYYNNRGKAIMLAVIGEQNLSHGANIGAAHTDAPRLDLKPNPVFQASGAELANIVNEAALRAVRDGRKLVTQSDLEESIEVVIAGYQKKNAIMTDHEKKIVAYHEIGHALVAARQTNSAPVQKITIIPRTSGALGYTMQVEEGNHYLMNKEELENKIATLTGGRAAEEIVFHSITTGASNDIEQATKLARAMLTRYGMSDEFGMVALETVQNQYLGGDTSLACAAGTQEKIDQLVVDLVRRQHEKAVQLLTGDREKLDQLAQYLYEKETITGEEFMKILNG